MDIQFWAIGKYHDDHVKNAVEDFTNRISKYFPVRWNIIPAPKKSTHLNEADLKRRESNLVLESLKKGDCLVALDEKGKQLSSPELATFIEKRAVSSTKQLIFFIGGAYGIDDALLKRSDYIWSLSKLTFPHQMVRLIISEQIYRACTILHNEKYHHS